jgi:hypothetical protein
MKRDYDFLFKLVLIGDSGEAPGRAVCALGFPRTREAGSRSPGVLGASPAGCLVWLPLLLLVCRNCMHVLVLHCHSLHRLWCAWCVRAWAGVGKSCLLLRFAVGQMERLHCCAHG